mgnify:CR=1 FL=1
MTVSIRSVLHNTQFKRADPVVEVEGKDLDTPVRWVFTNEREDVSSFLSGGEMLIIEGNALLAADWHGTLGQYVASLAQAGVAALVVELVEGVVRMPDELVSAARLHGLTLIGLKSRVPFVDICQSVNTAIVHEQMHLQLEVDTMSTSLREGLSRTGNIEAVAENHCVAVRRKASPFSMVTVCWPLERVVRSMPATNRAPSSPLKVAPAGGQHSEITQRTSDFRRHDASGHRHHRVSGGRPLY